MWKGVSCGLCHVSEEPEKKATLGLPGRTAVKTLVGEDGWASPPGARPVCLRFSLFPCHLFLGVRVRSSDTARLLRAFGEGVVVESAC